MDNQHRQITGYRELEQDEIDAMNVVKDQGADLEQLLVTVAEAAPEHDPRWLAIARTHFQEGLMALTRSVARPTSF